MAHNIDTLNAKDFCKFYPSEAKIYIEGTSDSLLHQMMEDYADAKKEDGWISVEDRLPENDDLVLGFTSFYSKNAFVTFYKNEIWGGRNLPVTHWQPLPLPPKK